MCLFPSSVRFMSDNPVKPVSTLLSFRHAAVQRMLGIFGVAFQRDAEGRSTPARVYPRSESAEDWVVEPPADDVSDLIEPKMFTGRAALLDALRYAHLTYVRVLYLSR